MSVCGVEGVAKNWERKNSHCLLLAMKGLEKEVYRRKIKLGVVILIHRHYFLARCCSRNFRNTR